MKREQSPRLEVGSAFPAFNSVSFNTVDNLPDVDTVQQDYLAYRKLYGTTYNGGTLVDVRPQQDFEENHFIGSTSIPVDELLQRLFELPPPYEKPISIVGSKKQLVVAREILESHRWRIDREIETDLSPWRSETSLSGRASRPVWEPNELLHEFFTSSRGKAWCSARESGVALDVGCGAGRDAVLMAQILGPSWQVIGVDNDAGARTTVSPSLSQPKVL